MEVYLGIDIGTSSTKTVAIDQSGNILGEASKSYPCYHPQPLWSEQDPDDWWDATVSTVKSVMQNAKLKASDVKSIGLSGQMHGAVFLDRNNKVVRRAILWNDQRTQAECDEIESAAGGRLELIKLVANPALTGFTAPKILWLRNNEPQHFEKTHKVLLPKDLIRHRLTGEFATDVSDASGMLLLDVAKRKWSNALLGKLKLDSELFAQCYESQDITGHLTAESAELLGLTTNCTVVGGAGDCAAGAIGSGIVTSGCVSTSIGTSGVVFAHSDQVEIDPSGRLHTFCHAVPGKWHMMGVTLASGGSLEWFCENLCKKEREDYKDSSLNNIYELLTDEASAVQTGSDELFFLPYLSGERTPHADPDARGSFIGLTLAHGRGHLVRSIMEGVVFSLRESFEIFHELGVPVNEIRASGQGARSQLWRQIQADAFAHDVVTLNAEKGAAFGVALLAATGSGAFKTIQEACAATIKVVETTNHNREATAYYNRAFPIYQGLYRSLRQDFKRISELAAHRVKEPVLQ
jgi:xylulokinase